MTKPEKTRLNRAVGANVKRLMRQKKMTQGALAEKIGVSLMTISRLVRADRTDCPAIDLLMDISKALDVPVTVILDERPLKLIKCSAVIVMEE